MTSKLARGRPLIGSDRNTIAYIPREETSTISSTKSLSSLVTPPDLGYLSTTDVKILTGRVRMPRKTQSLYPSRKIPMLSKTPLTRENRTW